MHVLMLCVYIITCVWLYDGCKVVYVCICETMPCVDAVFMYSMLVVAGDSWWSIPLNVHNYVCCVVIPISGSPSN